MGYKLWSTIFPLTFSEPNYSLPETYPNEWMFKIMHEIVKPSLGEWFFGLECGLFLNHNMCCSPSRLQQWIDLSLLHHHNILLKWEPNLHQWWHLHIQYPPNEPTIYLRIDRLSNEFNCIFQIQLSRDNKINHVRVKLFYLSHFIIFFKSFYELCLFHQPRYDDAHDRWRLDPHWKSILTSIWPQITRIWPLALTQCFLFYRWAHLVKGQLEPNPKFGRLEKTSWLLIAILRA